MTPWSIPRATVRLQLPALLESLDRLSSSGVNSSTGEAGGGVQSDESIWFTAVGALQDCIGTAALYASKDLRYEPSGGR